MRRFVEAENRSQSIFFPSASTTTRPKTILYGSWMSSSAVDASTLIVDHEITNVDHDREQRICSAIVGTAEARCGS